MERKIDTTNLRKVYFRLNSPYVWGQGISQENSDIIEAEAKEILNLIGLTILPDSLKTVSQCPPEGIKGCENLYMHPMSFSGILSLENFEKAKEVIENYESKIFTVRCIDVYEIESFHIKYIDSNIRKQAEIDVFISSSDSLDDKNPMCKKFADSESIPDEDGTCSLCGGDCCDF